MMTDSPASPSSDAHDTPKTAAGGDFDRRSHRILLALAEAMLPRDVGVPIPADENNIIKPARGFLRDVGSATFSAADIALWLFNLAPITLGFSWRTFLGLSPARREEFLAYWDNHPFFIVRLIIFPIKSLLTILYTIDPRYEEAVGYVPGSLLDDRRREASTTEATP